MTRLVDRSRGAFGALALGLVASAGCFSSGTRPDLTPPEPPPPAQLDLAVTYQRIDGFGASSAWTANNLTDAAADQFFSVDTGIGLSLLRVQIKPEGNTLELATAQKAVARGAKVWAAPWSPPGEWKDNGMTTNGGSLLPEHRQDWADRLAAFAALMSAQGIPLVAISAQNEPNYAATWDTCTYSPAQIVTFVRDFLGPTLAAQGQAVPVMAPETQGWNHFKEYADPIMADPAAVAIMGPLATHNYAGQPFAYASASAAGKVIWETEISDSTKAPDPGIDSGLRVAAIIHANLVQGNVSAWHYWWLIPGSDDNGGLAVYSTTTPTTLATRAWVLGNWSRFVRPGFVRVSVTAAPQDKVYLTAFKQPSDGRVVVVAVNQGSTERTQDFTIANGTIAELTPWVTSASQKLEPQAALPVADGAVSVALPARSVTSLVGTFTPDPSP
jgi:glucuronoarabinoxylan endo-1,4-beta-xylanase